MKVRSFLMIVAVMAMLACSGAHAQDAKSSKDAALPTTVADGINWRSIGPANMGGRITAVTVYEKDPSIWWAATASGGLLKTVNNGNDFEHQFDKEGTVSIGDVQVSQSDPNIVWVGTGESNPRNSVSWGDGAYKSTDGGKTWKNMGLKKTFQTGALAIHPTNPDIVWVGSLGRLWGPNEERGLFKTTDGGKTWDKVLYVDDKTGVVDVQVNPKNPDEMLVATYERKRDGFDGNDPVQRFGEGSGIFKSTDGGKTFDRVTKGLPSVKMGRIGLDYFESDPNFVYAIVESEKIGQEPPDFPMLGITGSDGEEVGSKISRLTAGMSGAKAGLKVGDIVVSVDGRIVGGHQAMLNEIYKHSSGETAKLVVIRDRKTIDVDLKLGKKPANSRSRRSYFTGTLGGQSGNKQDTQGEKGFEYGGIYMSKDGGSSWERINSLNPRPMYYSNIQVDPIDRNNIYVCGTSLYRSSDGGKTFTGDGGSDGIHVDHHALWIDKRDPKHMILGNDGGVHVTYDRMNHWDHHNHVAIGQFYHVGVDATNNYRVYGGLQDNGSWGGPSRKTGGMVNSDWFRVGGGDGFVTLVDPEDPNQIYYESQNGNMGRIHLETGARGFVRKPRGMRFNWKTPFMLSPHNSKIHYSVGNFVLRSYSQGDNAVKISPTITNSNRGAGSAVSESPRVAGVIYAGTTDGALWMTRDGGINWSPLAYSPAKPESKKADDKKADDKPATKKADQTSDKKADANKADAKKADAKKSDEKEAEPKGDMVTGVWNANMITDRIPADRAKFTINLKLDGATVTGTVSGRAGDQDISDGTYDANTGKVSFSAAGGRGSRSYSGVIKGDSFKGEMSIGGGRIEIEFEAKKDKEAPVAQPVVTNELAIEIDQLLVGNTSSMVGILVASNDDPVSGVWEGKLINDDLPNGEMDISMTMKMDAKDAVTGTISSAQGDIEITEGVFNRKTKRLIINGENENFNVEVSGTLEGDSIEGTIFVNDGQIEIEFTIAKNAAKTKEMVDGMKAADKAQDKAPEEKAPEKPQAESKAKPKAKPKAKEPKASASAKAQSKPQAQDKSQEKESDANAATAKKDDPVTGTWDGSMVMRNAERDLKLVLIRKSNSKITGTFETGQGEREITSGSYDPKTKTLTLSSDSDQFSLQFTGKVSGQEYAGEFGNDRFNSDFTLKRTSKSAEVKKDDSEEDKSTEESSKAAPTGEGSLASMMPGPRWVSSIEASRFKSSRVYATFDGHRSDDDGVYAFASEDYGKTWKSLTTNLPEGSGSVRVLREDVVNENLLYLGCEFSSWFSIDRGETWTRIGGLPTVAVHEFAIHPTAGEVVAGTHGRSLWIADVFTLRQMTKARMAEDLYLYKPRPVVRGSRGQLRGDSGTRRFVGEVPKTTTSISYSLGKNARSVSLEVFNLNGDSIQEFEELGRRKGFNSYEWDTRRVATGSYLVELKVDGQVRRQTVTVTADPSLSPRARAVLESEDELTEVEEFLREMMIED